MQSRRMSLIETITSILIGLVVSLLSQVLIFKHFGIHISLAQNLEITLYFTVVSVIRSYAVRRFFNNYNKKNNDDYCQEV